MKKKKSSRDKVLYRLESARGSFLSGEDIARDLGISRTAVWKAVNNLKNDGYMIDSVTNRGYCLTPGSDILSQESIRSYIREYCKAENDPDHPESPVMPDPASIDMDVFDTVGSTNTVCLKRASSGEYGTYAAIAGGQTRGRGRRGRSFFSPSGTGLYMSILVRPDGLDAGKAVKLTTVAAVAAAEAIEAVSGHAVYIKWVNDIYTDGRKVCGILTEASFNPEDGTLDYAVVGIGVNVYEPEGGFPEDIRTRAGALAGPLNSGSSDGESRNAVLESGGRNRLAAEILCRFFGYLGEILAAESQPVGMRTGEAGPRQVPSYVSEYRRRCFVIGKEADVIRPGAEPKSALVLGVDDECRLQVRYSDGSEETLGSGEISIKERKQKSE